MYAAPLLLGGGLDPGVKFLWKPQREIYHGTIIDAEWMYAIQTRRKY